MEKVVHKKIGEIEIPASYFELPEDEKSALCIGIMNVMLELINQNAHPNFDRIMILEKLLESSIITNQEDENYEICALLTDIQKLTNAQRS